MADVEVQLREVAFAFVAGAPEPPSFEDLFSTRLVKQSASRWRGPLIAAAVATLVVLALAAFVLVQVELDDGRTAPAAPPDATGVQISENGEEGAGAQAPTYAEELARCDQAPLHEINRDGSSAATVSAVDVANREVVQLDARAYCRAKVELSAPTGSGMWSEVVVENGHIVAHYYELIGNATSRDQPVPPDQAARRIAATRAERGDR